MKIQLKETPFGFHLDHSCCVFFGEIWLPGLCFSGLWAWPAIIWRSTGFIAGACRMDDEDILKDYQRLSREAELKKPPKLLKNDRLTTPVLAGLFHPQITLRMNGTKNRSFALF